MTEENRFNRRRFLALSGSIAVTGLAGCSDNGENGTPVETPPNESTDTPTSSDGGDTNDTETDTTTEDELEPSTPRGTPEPPSGSLIDSLSDYRYVVQNPDEWVGNEIRAEGVQYFEPYQEDYQGFRAVYESEDVARPFMLKTDEEFRSNQSVNFTGTVEKIGELQGVKIIFVENVTIE